jgi:hypothetical protein
MTDCAGREAAGPLVKHQLHQSGIARTRRLRWTVAAIALSTPAIALAYVDPGTGAYLVQSIIALVGVATFYAMRPIRFLRKLFVKQNKPESQD